MSDISEESVEMSPDDIASEEVSKERSRETFGSSEADSELKGLAVLEIVFVREGVDIDSLKDTVFNPPVVLEVFLVHPKVFGVVFEVETIFVNVVLLGVLFVFLAQPILVISKVLLVGLLVVAVQQFSAVKK